MSRYYFDLDNGDGQTVDQEGLELPSLERASKEASRIVGDLARDEIAEVEQGTICLTIRNSKGETIARTTLTFATEWVG
ncbi:MAG: DUF6894 family protein [Phyllobacterium sp.]